jgi:hypothetical protein
MHKDLIEIIIQYLRLLAKIHIVILSEAKNLIFFFSSQKIKKRSFGLRPQDDTER